MKRKLGKLNSKSGKQHSAYTIRRKARRGLTMVELLIVVLIVIVVIPVMIRIYLNSHALFERASTIMNLSQTGRHMMERLKRDIRESSWWLKVTDDPTLTFTRFELSSKGGLVYDPKGYPVETGEITYAVDGSTLVRNGKVVGEKIKELTFTLTPEVINKKKIPTIAITLTINESGHELFFTTRVVPRHLASWARDPYWISNARGQPTVYEY